MGRNLTTTLIFELFFCKKISLKADLHGTTLSHTTSLRKAYDINCSV